MAEESHEGRFYNSIVFDAISLLPNCIEVRPRHQQPARGPFLGAVHVIKLFDRPLGLHILCGRSPFDTSCLGRYEGKVLLYFKTATCLLSFDER